MRDTEEHSSTVKVNKKLDWFNGLETELDYVCKQWHFAIKYASVVIDELVLEEYEIWRYDDE